VPLPPLLYRHSEPAGELLEMHNVDDPQAFHALITQATVDEISLTDRPCNPQAIVQYRRHAGPKVSFHELLQRHVQCLIEMVDILKAVIAEPPACAAPRTEVRRPPVIHSVRRPTPFQQLVQEINREQHQASS
jgi:hypothetical protein